MVRIGLELFHELGERIRKTEVANQSLRDALTQLAARVGVVAPDLFGEEGGEEFDGWRMREWLGEALSGPLGKRKGSGEVELGVEAERVGVMGVEIGRTGDLRLKRPWLICHSRVSLAGNWQSPAVSDVRGFL